MAEKQPLLKLVVTARAQRDLHHIWDYNFDTYDADHADSYLKFLADQTSRLRREYLRGKIVPTRRRPGRYSGRSPGPTGASTARSSSRTGGGKRAASVSTCSSSRAIRICAC